MNAVVFRDCKCACGGTLFKANSDGLPATEKDEVKFLKCNKCCEQYFIIWNIDDGAASPSSSKQKSIDDFMKMYKR